MTTKEEKTLVQAIEDKYSVGEDEPLSIEIYVPKGAPGQKDTGEIVVPQVLSLHCKGITCAGDEIRIDGLCKNVTQLDLSENNITSWLEVFKIIDKMPVCSFLDLRLNPLCHIIDCNGETNVYPCVAELVLNDLRLPWNTVLKLLKIFPRLHELHLSLNGYADVALSGETYPSLLSLHFNHNALSDWQEVAKLGQAFPNLENLVLLQNPIQVLPSAEEIAIYFPKLKNINVSHTGVSDWTELEKFRGFPSLTDIRVQGLTFLQDYTEELRRQLILAYLPNIQRLNGGKVSEGEKEDAERAFIRHYMAKEGPVPDRYHELEAKHGKLDALVDVDLTAKKGVTLTVHYQDRSFLKDVNLDWTLVTLKKELARDLGLAASKMNIYHTIMIYNQGADLMRFPTRTLLRYNVNDGDRLDVDEKIVMKK